MTDTLKQARSDLKAARARLRALHETRQAGALNARADQLELAGSVPALRRLIESNTTPLGPTTLDYVTAYSLLIDRLRGEPYTYNITSPYDRKWGRNFPIYQSEAELSLLRAPSRVLCQTNTYAQAIVGGLSAYIIGEGFMYRVAPREKVKALPDLVDAVQSVVDRFLARNQWTFNNGPWAEMNCLYLRPIEDEFFERTLRDGEALLVHYWDEETGTTIARFVEPEFLTQPPGGRWEEWSFGWETPANDEQDKRAAWITWDGNPANGERYTIDRLAYLPRNTDRILKRGVPDFSFDAGDAVMTGQKLRRALAVGGATKASIVGVRQHKAQTATQTTAFRDSLTDYQQIDLATGVTQNMRRYTPGEWEDIDENMEYVRGPSTDCEDALIHVLEATLRGAVVRWNGFEWLISADASSNSYANALAAESPAVKRIRKEQAMYKCVFLKSISIAVKDAADAGLIRAQGRTWEWLELKQFVEVQIEAPSPEVRDQQGEAQRDIALMQARIKSPQTICQEQGMDYEREMKNLQEHEDRFGGMGVPLMFPEEEATATGGLPGVAPPKTPQPKVKQAAAPETPRVAGASLESKDASGHEHDAKGLFTGTGGDGSKSAEKPSGNKSSRLDEVGKRLDSLLKKGGELDKAHDNIRRMKAHADGRVHTHELTNGKFGVFDNPGTGKSNETHLIGVFDTEEKAKDAELSRYYEIIKPSKDHLKSLEKEMEDLRKEEDELLAKGRAHESALPPGTTIVHHPSAGPSPGVDLTE